MSHEQDLSMAAPYVLDALDDLDRARFERHLAGCDECIEEVAALRAGLDQIVQETATPPPAHVRRRVMDQIESIDQAPAPISTPHAPRRTRTRLWVAIAALSALVIALGGILTSGSDPLDDLLALPDTRVVAVGETDAYLGSATADVVVSGDGDTVYLRVENLEAAPDRTVYAVWLIRDDGPRPAGLFLPDSDGDVTLALEGMAGSGVLVGVTVEPEGGSPQPTTDVLFLGDLG